MAMDLEDMDGGKIIVLEESVRLGAGLGFDSPCSRPSRYDSMHP